MLFSGHGIVDMVGSDPVSQGGPGMQFIVKLPEVTLGFTFRHIHQPKNKPDTVPGDKGGCLYMHKTHCTCYEIKGHDAIFRLTATAYTSLWDNFNKVTGRKVALTKALDRLLLSKENRTLVWKTYLTKPEAPTPANIAEHKWQFVQRWGWKKDHTIMMAELDQLLTEVERASSAT